MHIHVLIHTYTHTNMHRYVHIYVHIYTYTYTCYTLLGCSPGVHNFLIFLKIWHPLSSLYLHFGMFHTGHNMPFMITSCSSRLKKSFCPFCLICSLARCLVKYACLCTLSTSASNSGGVHSCRSAVKCPELCIYSKMFGKMCMSLHLEHQCFQFWRSAFVQISCEMFWIMHIYIYIYIYIFVYVCIMCVCVCICVCVCVCAYVCVCVSVCTHVSIYCRQYMCMYVWGYVCTWLDGE